VTDIQAEFGSAFPFRFLDPSQVKGYDSEGQEVEGITCPICGLYMNLLFGNGYSLWTCANQCDHEDTCESPPPLKSYKVQLCIKNVEQTDAS
jgi:hypothetical protein